MKMKRISSWVVLAGMLGAAVLAGCGDSRGAGREPVKDWMGTPVKALSVSESASDPAIYHAVLGAETARVNYRYCLTVLEGYYNRVGNNDKHQWASRELKNLDDAQWFTWEGLPNILPQAGQQVSNADERLLVEETIKARENWKTAMLNLALIYDKNNDDFKAKVVRRALHRLDFVYTYKYFMDAELPPVDLSPSAVITEADQMFDQAYKLFREGKGLIPYLSTAIDKERQSLELFQDLIAKYPRSTKIALSAYYIGDIYKEYFDEPVRAAWWYERAWQWQPNVTEPARFQAAVLYDYRLQNRAKAVQCYRDSLKFDPERTGNADVARRRIRELTGKSE